jgi:hypothetical protein
MLLITHCEKDACIYILLCNIHFKHNKMLINFTVSFNFQYHHVYYKAEACQNMVSLKEYAT